MADTTNPMDANAMHAASSRPMAQATPVATTRPGMVTFASVVMLILGGFQLTWAIVEFSNAAWLSGTVYGNFNGYLWLWAILDLLLAAASFYAGYDVLRGGAFGYMYAVLVAAFAAVRWFFLLPVAPWLGIVVIALAILVIYGLIVHSDYFRERMSR